LTGRFVLVLCLTLLSVGVGVALAAPGDRSSTEATLADLEKDPATKELTADAVKKSRAALERATRMRASGDDTHARLAEGVAHDWAEVGKELARAADLEKKATSAHFDSQDASVQMDRERAMLEQRVAENGRLVTELALVDAGASKVVAAVDAGRTPTQSNKKDGGK
jgi:hypothetical protein